MKFKPGVSLDGIQPQMLRAMAVIDDIYRQMAGDEATMTSALDSHTSGLHPLGLAGDFRLHGVPRSIWSDLAERIRFSLNIGFSVVKYGKLKLYDVVLELDTGNEHIHVEYDPKLL